MDIRHEKTLYNVTSAKAHRSYFIETDERTAQRNLFQLLPYCDEHQGNTSGNLFILSSDLKKEPREKIHSRNKDTYNKAT